MFQEGRIDFKIVRILKLFEVILKFRPGRPLMTAPISFQEFQEHQEFQAFQEIATHFKSVSGASKIYQEFQEFQEHVSRVTDKAGLNSVYPTLLSQHFQ